MTDIVVFCIVVIVGSPQCVPHVRAESDARFGDFDVLRAAVVLRITGGFTDDAETVIRLWERPDGRGEGWKTERTPSFDTSGATRDETRWLIGPQDWRMLRLAIDDALAKSARIKTQKDDPENVVLDAATRWVLLVGTKGVRSVLATSTRSGDTPAEAAIDSLWAELRDSIPSVSLHADLSGLAGMDLRWTSYDEKGNVRAELSVLSNPGAPEEHQPVANGEDRRRTTKPSN